MEKMANIVNDKNWKALIKPSKIDVKTHENKSIAIKHQYMYTQASRSRVPETEERESTNNGTA